jgi:crotonobetaine/carnitine-CoA ligase
VRQYGCTTTTAPVSILLEAPPHTDDRDNPLRIAFGAHNPVQSTCFGERFGVHMVDSYGSTEVGFPIVRRWPSQHPRSGWLRRGYAARVVDKDGHDVTDGQPGELWVLPPARPLITLGYVGREDLTSQAIVAGWYRTGDLLTHWPDGGFQFLDRMSDTIRRLGENISSTALEWTVATDPEVVECAAIGVPDPVTGHEVMIAVVPRQPETFDPARLYERLVPQLPRYMHPALIVTCDALPHTATEKVTKAGLLARIDLERAWRSPSSRGAPSGHTR